jgi:hypothetical protein
MNGIERADRFHRERLARAHEYEFGEGNDIASPSESLQPAERSALISWRQAPSNTSAHESAGGFCECQS